MTDLEVLMEEAEVKLRGDIDLSDEWLSVVVELTTLSREQIDSILSPANINDYLDFRVHEYLLKQGMPKGVILDDATEEFFADKDRLKRTRGRPERRGLNRLYYILADWWNARQHDVPKLPQFEKAWSPQFEKRDGLTNELNPMATLFLKIAETFEEYTAEDCRWACENAKDARRSPKAAAKRKAGKRKVGKRKAGKRKAASVND